MKSYTFLYYFFWGRNNLVQNVTLNISKPKINKYNSSQYIFRYPYIGDFRTGNCNFINKRPQLLWLIFRIYTMHIKQSDINKLMVIFLVVIRPYAQVTRSCWRSRMELINQKNAETYAITQRTSSKVTF